MHEWSYKGSIFFRIVQHCVISFLLILKIVEMGSVG